MPPLIFPYFSIYQVFTKKKLFCKIRCLAYNLIMRKNIKKIIVFIIVLFVFMGFSSSKGASKSIYVNKAYHLLFVKESSSFQKVVPVCTGKGRDEETPTGTFTIVSIIHNPNWYFEGKTYKPYIEDEKNGLGICWMGLSISGYGVHGTNAPFSPGRNLSHGCVRMNNTDIEKISSISFLGEKVEIKNGNNDTIAKHLKAINMLYDIENVLKEAK